MGEAVIYLDNQEKTHPCGPAIESLKRTLEETPSYESHLQIVRDLAGASQDDSFVFTSSGAEAVNQVLWSVYMEVARKSGKCHFIASTMEDAPTMQMLKRLEELGCFAKMIPIKENGEIDVLKLAELISPRTALVSVTLAHGLTGVIQPIEEIANLCKEKGVLLHVEGSYAIGKIYFSFAEHSFDYLTFSGDFLHAVKGSGALFAKKSAPLIPLILGGKGLRGGPFDLLGFMSFSASVRQAALSLERMSLEVARLRNFFESEVIRLVPNAKILFHDSFRLPNTSVIAFLKVHQEALLYLLFRKQVHASIGGSYSQHLHRILMSAQIDEKTAESAISFSLSRMTTEEDICKAVLYLAECVKVLSVISEDIP